MKLKQFNAAVNAKLAESDGDGLSVLSLKPDGDEAMDVLARAFAEDPMMKWVAGLNDDDPQREEKMYRLCRYMHAWMSHRYLTGSRGITVGLREGGALVGCMSVAPSSCHLERWIEMVVAAYRYGSPPMYKEKTAYCVTSAKRLDALKVLHAKRSAHMKGTAAWLYLNVIGVRPGDQGKGYGKKMLLWLHGVAEKLGVPVYLETESKENESLYQKFGYRTLEKIDLEVPGDPTTLRMYLMRRDL